ncbi:MAG: DNA-binding protein [Deltaproteobacteria bacterium]|nr:MAG: DNA-binding protein [Deltaproteobacteria bacterium]
MRREVNRGRIFIGRLERGDDLLAALTDVCVKEGVKIGRVEAIGAVESATVGFYDQDIKVYEYIEIAEPMELLALLGNVSTINNETMLHAHVTLGDDAGGHCRGGHLAPGTVVFACEYIIEELIGEALVRGPEEATGLSLWVD